MSSSATLSSAVNVRTDFERYFGAESIPGGTRILLEASTWRAVASAVLPRLLVVSPPLAEKRSFGAKDDEVDVRGVRLRADGVLTLERIGPFTLSKKPR